MKSKRSLPFGSSDQPLDSVWGIASHVDPSTELADFSTSPEVGEVIDQAPFSKSSAAVPALF